MRPFSDPEEVGPGRLGASIVFRRPQGLLVPGPPNMEGEASENADIKKPSWFSDAPKSVLVRKSTLKTTACQALNSRPPRISQNRLRHFCRIKRDPANFTWRWSFGV